MSIVCEEEVYVKIKDELPVDAPVESNRVAFGIDSILDMSMTGVLSRISALLAEAGVPIFVVSTYNTDWILVHKSKFEKAKAVLEKKGHSFS